MARKRPIPPRPDNNSERLARIEQYVDRTDFYVRVLALIQERTEHVLRALHAQSNADKETLMATLAEYQAEIAKLTAEVARGTDVDTSANVLLTKLTGKIQELIDNGGGADIPVAELQQLNDAIKASTDALAEAVAANTPAE